MMKATVFAVGMLASSVAMADPLMDSRVGVPDSGPGARYTLSFGGSGNAPLSHSLALSSGSALTRGQFSPVNVMEMRWTGRQPAQLWVAGRPFAARGLNAKGGDDGWFTDAQALYLMAAGGALLTGIVVANYRDESDDSGTGSSSGN